MGFLDYFKQVPSMTADEVKRFIGKLNLDDYSLLDVRQPKEYKKGHLAGALLIPVGHLPSRMEELDSQKPVIVYCAIGGRSRAAASMLLQSGFVEVYNMTGGYKAWHGVGVKGPPDSGMAYFGHISDPVEVLVLAWAMEEGTRKFYESMAGQERDRFVKKIYTELAYVEATHQNMLEGLYRELVDLVVGENDHLGKLFLDSGNQEQVMEGQLKLSEALGWARGRKTLEVLQYSMALEATLFDLYFRLKLRFPSGGAHTIFSRLAQQEKQHLQRFSEFLEENIT